MRKLTVAMSQCRNVIRRKSQINVKNTNLAPWYGVASVVVTQQAQVLDNQGHKICLQAL